MGYMLVLLAFVLWKAIAVSTDTCASQISCTSCTTKNTYVPFLDVKCRWCPLDRKCHTFGSNEISYIGEDNNPCGQDMNVKESSLCEGSNTKSQIYNESKALMLAKLSAVAYAEPEYLSKCINHILPNDDFEIVEAIGRKCERWFDYKECFVYTAISHKTKTILVGYRGTAGDGLQKFIQIADEGLVELAMCREKLLSLAYQLWRGNVNTYFSFAFKRLFDPCIRESVKRLANHYQNYEVVVTGHSLGGALASLTAYALVKEGVVSKDRMTLYTFGMPRVGDKTYAFDHDKDVPNSWRITHWRDPVPRMPFKKCGYYHHKTAVLYPQGMTSGSEYTICTDNEDLTCNKLLTVSFSQHSSYFGLDLGGYCKTNLKYKRDTEESRFPEDHCKVISLKDADEIINTEIKTVTSSACDFQKDFCDWTRASGSTFSFKRIKGPSDESGKTGPAYDRHKSVTGYYIFADASNNEGQIAKLRSPNFPAGPYCVEFYYHMFGSLFKGSLKLVMYATGTKSKEILSKDVSLGVQWFRFRADVKADSIGNGTFHFEFEARIGNSFTSDVALDDISITQGRCPK